MHIYFSKTPPALPPLHINGHGLHEVRVAKLLGVWVQADLKSGTHVNFIIKQSAKSLFLLRQLKKFHLPQNDLLAVYTCYVRPHLEYAAPVWSPGLTSTQAKQLENIQRRACRTILGKHYNSYPEACTQLNLPSLVSRHEQLCRKYGRGLLKSTAYRDWLPLPRGEISGRQSRSCNKLETIFAKTARFHNSCIPHIVRLLNSSPY
ncbi:Hypp3636 [Branchiostoma lanceolatum]|uniref:Hypp3636 protein n=1 Tax=Branchiostoma lanceolatum TaxID=7740 RepID=A0A8K0A1N7_BRALA|nr:Hypp3636 [Branchiostoma lanceolatum]